MLLTDEAIGIGVPRFCRPIRGTAKSHPRTPVAVGLERHGQLSPSFSACCNPSGVCLTSGTRHAKARGFDHVRPYEPYRQQCLGKQEFTSTRWLHLPLETLM